MKNLLKFAHEIGTIMYVGTILSHILIGILFSHADPETTAIIYTYKEQSAYILILPGLALKILSDLISFFAYGERAWWMRIKLAMTAFLTINAFIFLVPMMPELRALAQASIADGHLSQAFLDLEATEKIVGMSNIVPLIVEMVMGTFRPKMFAERRHSA